MRMRTKRIFIWVALVATLLLILTGCSLNQQEIFNAALKMQDVNSKQVHTTMTFKLSGSGFSSKDQQQIDSVAMLINNATLDFDIKTKSNEQKTVSQTQEIMNLTAPGMAINVPVWVDLDLAGSTPKLNEIVKLPPIAKTSLPQQLASKDYMVISPMDKENSELGYIDLAKLTELSQEIRDKEISFLESYSKRFNPNFDTVSTSTESMTTSDGYKLVRRYEIRLDDKQFKEFIRYTVNNFVQDKEAINFVKDLMDFSLQMSQVPDKEKSLDAFNKAFEQFDTEKQTQFLANFNTQMDQLNDVTILGDKGLDLQFYLYNGYLIKESGTINLNLDLAQMNHLIGGLNDQQSVSDAPQGTLDMLINFNTDITGINTPIEINIPEINKTNSFSMKDILGLSEKVKEKN